MSKGLLSTSITGTLLLWGLLAFSVWYLGFLFGRTAYAQSPNVTSMTGLILERDDFPAATAGQTTFTTVSSPHNHVAFFYRNGLLQRPCSAGVTTGCDYVQSGIVTATYPAGMIQAGDLVTALYYH